MITGEPGITGRLWQRNISSQWRSVGRRNFQTNAAYLFAVQTFPIVFTFRACCLPHHLFLFLFFFCHGASVLESSIDTLYS
jgi:hypothetical protein